VSGSRTFCPASEHLKLPHPFGSTSNWASSCSSELKKQGLLISLGAVRNMWFRHDLETFKKRLKALKARAGWSLAYFETLSQTGFVSDSSRQCSNSSVRSHFERSPTNRFCNFSTILIDGSRAMTKRGHMQQGFTSARCQVLLRQDANLHSSIETGSRTKNARLDQTGT